MCAMKFGAKAIYYTAKKKKKAIQAIRVMWKGSQKETLVTVRKGG